MTTTRSLLLAALLAGCSSAPSTPPPGSTDAGAPVDDGGATIDRDDAGGSEPDREDAQVATSDAGVGIDAGAIVCPEPAPTDYACGPGAGECAGGICLSGLCVGADTDPHRWDGCGDGACGPCETDASCPADCGPAPIRTALPTFDPATTITIKLHGLSVGTGSSLDDRTYGAIVSDGALEDAIRPFAPAIRDAASGAPDALVAVEYYGTHAADWMTPDQVAAVESFEHDGDRALHRYALIVAMSIRHLLETTGATHANIACHSMGCHVTRYLVEHDLEHLATDGILARVLSVAGALAGAGLAEMYDNPTVRDWGALSPIETRDFVHLHPDYVRDHSAIWDHRLHEANNPTWAGISLHEITGDDPTAAGGIGAITRPLDITEQDVPNDSILYARDTFFVSMAESNRLVTSEGTRVMPSHTWTRHRHPDVEEQLGTGALAAAHLWHSRRVTITLTSLTVLDDHEGGIGGGSGDAEVVPQVEVRFDAIARERFGITEPVVVHELRVAHRSSPVVRAREGVPLSPGLVVFEGPVFDGQTSLDLDLELREVDRYPTYGIDEALFGDGSALGSFSGSVALEDGTITIETEDVRATLDVDVLRLY